MFTLIIPVYNDADKITNAVEKAQQTLKNIPHEIVIAEDGSTDGSDRIASNLSKKYKNVLHSHSDKRLGRGDAIKKALKISKGDTAGYMDVDIATDMRHLTEIIKYLKDYDVVTGSRYLNKEGVMRSGKRLFLSKVYNTITRAILRSSIKDHQCGFKVFKKDVIDDINKKVKAKHWFWDTEMLVLAQRHGYRVKEIPVSWKETKKTKVSLRKDILQFTLNLLELRIRLFFE